MDRPDLAPPDDRLIGWRDLTVWTTPVGRRLASAGGWLARLLGPHVALLATLLVAGLLVTALTAASAEIYDEVEDGEGIADFDRPSLELALRLRSSGLDRAITAFTDLGSVVGMTTLAVLATLAMTVAWRRRSPAVLMLAATAGSVSMTVVGKSVVGRTRPPLADAVPPYESSASFPSGHALNAVVVAGLLADLLVRRQRRGWARIATLTAAATFAALMGASRVYLGHHWLTDVLVAWTLGLAWLTLVVVAHRLFLTVSRRRTRSPDRAAAPSLPA